MPRMFFALAASAAVLASLAAVQVRAAPESHETAKPAKPLCFRSGQISNWATNNDHMIYVKLQTGAVFQVTLANACTGLDRYQTLAFDPSFSDRICDDGRATVITRSGVGPLHCRVRSLRALTREEARALPDAQRP